MTTAYKISSKYKAPYKPREELSIKKYTPMAPLFKEEKRGYGKVKDLHFQNLEDLPRILERAPKILTAEDKKIQAGYEGWEETPQYRISDRYKVKTDKEMFADKPMGIMAKGARQFGKFSRQIQDYAKLAGKTSIEGIDEKAVGKESIRAFASSSQSQVAGGVGDLLQWTGGYFKDLSTREAVDIFGTELRKKPDWENKAQVFIGRHLEDYGKLVSDWWQKESQRGVLAPDPTMYKGGFMENPSWERAVGTVSQAIPSMGVAAGITWATGNPILGAMALGFTEGAGEYIQAKEVTGDFTLANRVGTANALVLTVLEDLPLERFFKGGSGKLAKDVFVGMGMEGTEEFLQTLWTNVVAKIGYDKTRDLTAGLAEATIVGAIMGGVMGGLSSASIRKGDAIIEDARNSGVSQQEIDQMTEGIANQVASNAAPINKKLTQQIAEFINKGVEQIKKGIPIGMTIEDISKEPTKPTPKPELKPQQPLIEEAKDISQIPEDRGYKGKIITRMEDSKQKWLYTDNEGRPLADSFDTKEEAEAARIEFAKTELPTIDEQIAKMKKAGVADEEIVRKNVEEEIRVKWKNRSNIDTTQLTAIWEEGQRGVKKPVDVEPKEFVQKLLPLIPPKGAVYGEGFITREGKRVTAKQILRQQKQLRDREIKQRRIWSDQEKLSKVVHRGGYTDKTISLLRKHKVPEDIINSLRIEGKYLKDLVKIKREKTGEISAVISKRALDYIKKTSKLKDVGKEWVKKVSFRAVRGDAIDIIQGYETGARFFKRLGSGFKNLVFDPIRAGERLAVQRADRLKNIKLKSVFKLSKKEAKQLWAYTSNKQGKDVETLPFNKLPLKVRIAYGAIRRTVNELYPIVKKITTKRGREIGEVKNYTPLYTKDDIKLLDEGGFDFTRKDPFFGSIKGRVEAVPVDMYEKDYRKVIDSWISGVSKYIDVGDRTVGVKYLIDSKEFQDIAGKDASKKIQDWYKYIVSPPKVEGVGKGLRVLRNMQAVAILGFKYTVPIKQFLNLFDFGTMLPAKRLMRATLGVYGRSPSAKLARQAGSVQERSLGFAIQDLKNMIVSWGRKPAEFTDRLTAKIGRIALVDQMLIRNKKNDIKLTPKELKNMEKLADDIVDAVMGAMSKAETPKYFRTELGKNINMFYSQLNSKMQYYVTDIFRDKKYADMSGNKAKLLAKALVAVLIAGYIESTINKLYFVDEPEDIAKDSLRQIAGNFPIIGGVAFALETGLPYAPMPVLGNIVKLITAISRGQAGKALWTGAGFAGFPSALERLITGGMTVKKGGVYNKKGKLLFRVDTPAEQARTLLKGKWGSKAAQEYFEAKDEPKEPTYKIKSYKIKEPKYKISDKYRIAK